MTIDVANKRSLVAPWLALAAAVPLTALVAVMLDRRLSNDGHGEHGAHEEQPESEKRRDEHGGDRVKLSDEGRKNAGIEMGKAGPGNVSITLALPGEVMLNADKTAHVTPRVAGTVKEVKKQLGDVVKKGDVLATLDSKELAELSGKTRAAEERLKLAKANFTRVEKLFDEKIVPEKDYLAAKQGLAEAQIDAEATSQMLATTGTGPSGTYRLVAPLDGTIIEKHASVGEVLKDDTRVFVIADLSTVWVDVTVYTKDLAKVSVGLPVAVRADGLEKPLVGSISFVGSIAKAGSRAAQARVVLDNPAGKLKPGLFVTADVALEQGHAAVVVPDDAVQTVDGSSVIFVEEDGAFEARKIKVGRIGVSSADPRLFVEVLAGLSAGESFVEKGSFTLKAELGKGAAGHDH